MLVNQKYHSKLDSITTEKVLKDIPKQYQLGNTSTSTAMTSGIRKIYYHRATKKHNHNIN